MSRLSLASLLLLAACSSSKNTSEPPPASEDAPPKSQSFQEGMQRLCDSVNEVDRELSPSDRQRAVAQWIDTHVSNEQVRELFTIMAQVPPSKRAGMMKAAATKAGIASCAIAEQ